MKDLFMPEKLIFLLANRACSIVRTACTTGARGRKRILNKLHNYRGHEPVRVNMNLVETYYSACDYNKEMETSFPGESVLIPFGAKYGEGYCVDETVDEIDQMLGVK